MSDRRTFTIDSGDAVIGDYRIRVAEHADRGFVGIDVGRASHAMMLEPAQLVQLAAELLAVAARIVERRFEQRLGSP